MDPAITHPIARIRKRQILLLDRKLLPSHIKRHRRQLVRRRVRREDVTLLVSIILAARNGVVDGLARSIIDEREGGPGIRDGGVAASIDGLAVNDGGGAGEHPEALGVVDGGVVGFLATEGLLVDEAKGVERGAFVGIFGVVDGAEVGGEEFLVFGDVLLGDHVLDGGRYRFGGDGIDGAEGEAEKSVTGSLFELSRESLGKFDGLIFDYKTAEGDVVGANGA